ncbi:MAG: hypothetical protein ACTSRZ_01955 [Promethearchaeota archaeon]
MKIKLAKKRIISFILLMALSLPILTSLNLYIETSDDVIKNLIDNKNPESSQINEVTAFYINGTRFYEYGTWELYLNESMKLALDVSADVTEAYFWYQHSSGGPIVNDTISSGTTYDYEETYYFDGTTTTGIYNAKIILKNSTNEFTNFTFYFKISDPSCVIYRVFLRDTKWNNQWEQIYEHQTIETYRNTTLELVAQVGNKDDLISGISNVNLKYQDGNTTIWKSTDMTKGALDSVNGIPVYNYTSNDIQTNFNASVLGRTKWKLGGIFEVYINATDDNGGFWVFPFKIKILNRPPKIVDFTVSNGDIPSPGDPGEFITFTFNVTDLEDDVIYSPTSTTLIEKVKVASNYRIDEEGVNINWVPTNYSHTIVDIFTINQIGHPLEFQSGGAYYINYSVGEFYHKHITNWFLSFTYWTNTSNNLALWIYNQTANGGSGTWVSTTMSFTGNDTAPTWKSDSIQFPMSSYNLSDFCTEKYGYRLMIKINKTLGSAINFTLDYTNMTYWVNQRYSVPQVNIKVYDPLDNLIYYDGIDIFEFWDTDWAPGNRWSFKYYLPNTSIYGAYSFVITVSDWGSLITDDIFHLVSYFNPFVAGKDQGIDEVTYVLNFGVNRDEINHVAQNGVQIANRQAISPDSSTVVSITVADKTNAYWTNKYENYSIDQTAIYQQNGSTYYTVDTNNYSIVQGSQYHSDRNLLNFNDDNATNITMTTNAQQSIIFKYKLDKYFWLNEENITGIMPHWNWYFNDIGQSIGSIRISFWNWSSNDWTSTIWQNSSVEEFCPLPVTKFTKGKVYSPSTWLTDLNTISDIINETENNLLMIRFEIMAAGGLSQPLNLSLVYEALEIRYNNTYSATLYVQNDDNLVYTYRMNDAYHNASIKTWQCTIPTDQYTNPNYAISFLLQNGNSTVKMFARRFETYYDPLYDEWYKRIIADYSEETWYSRNQTFSIRDRTISTSFNPSDLTITRSTDLFMVNGTLSSEGKIDVGNYTSFLIELRKGNESEYSDWIFYPRSSVFTYDVATGFWNISKYISNNTEAGRYFYRLRLETVQGQVFATDWAEVTFLNFQPRVVEVNTLNVNGQFYRENTAIPFDIRIREIETDISNLKLEFGLIALDRSTSHNQFLWTRQTSFSYVALGDDYFNLTGTFTFGSDINIGNYNHFYIRLIDDDPISSQIGAQRIFANIQILDNSPQWSQTPQPNVSSLYRTNTVQISWNFTDLDDFDVLNNFTITTFTITDPSSNVHPLNVGNIIYDAAPSQMRFEYDYQFSISNQTGIYTFTIAIQDPDGLQISNTTTVTVLNNLPTLSELKIENLATNTYATLVQDNNLTDFSIYRGTQQMRVTVNLTDIEDSYLNDAAISRVYLSFTHKFTAAQIGDPWTDSANFDTDLTLINSASQNGNGIQTWSGTLTLPVADQFYSGDCYINVHMVDDDLDEAINSNNEFLVRNSPIHFTGPLYEIEIDGVKNKHEVIRGQNIIVRVYFEDNDFNPNDPNNELGPSRAIISYKIIQGTYQKSAVAHIDEDEWQYDSSSGSIILTLKTDDSNKDLPAPSNLQLKISILSITLFDNDFGYIVNTTKTGADQASILDINYEITFVEVEVDLTWLYILLGVIGAVALGLFIVWYYRKYFSYKRYMEEI